MALLNEKYIIIGLTLLYIIPECLTQDVLPVIITDESGIIEKADFGNPFVRINAESFKNLIRKTTDRLNESVALVFFIDDYLTTEDLSSKDSLGTPFPHFNQHLRKNNLIYLPSVENPYDVLIKVCPKAPGNTYVVTKENGEIQIQNRDDKHIYIIFADHVRESRLQRLRRHGKIIQQFVTAYKDFTGRNIVALYTGREALGSNRNARVEPTNRIASKGTLVHGQGGIFNLKSFYSETGQEWRLLRSKSELVDEPRTTHQMEYIIFDSVVLGMNFSFTPKTWTLLTIGIMDNAHSREWLDSATVLATVPINNSYHCAIPYTFVSRRDKVTKFHLKEYQIQPFKIPGAEAQKKLKEVSGEFVSSTPPILPDSTQSENRIQDPMSDEINVAQKKLDVESTSDSSPINAKTGTPKSWITFNIQKHSQSTPKDESTTESEELVSFNTQKLPQSTLKDDETTESGELISFNTQKLLPSTPKDESTTESEELLSFLQKLAQNALKDGANTISEELLSFIQKFPQTTLKDAATTNSEELLSFIQKNSQSTPKHELTSESEESFNIQKQSQSTRKDDATTKSEELTSVFQKLSQHTLKDESTTESEELSFNNQKQSQSTRKDDATTKSEELTSVFQKLSQNFLKDESTMESEELSFNNQKHSQSTLKEESTIKSQELSSFIIQKHSRSTLKDDATTKSEKFASVFQKLPQNSLKDESITESGEVASFNIREGLSSTFKKMVTIKPQITTHISDNINPVSKEWIMFNPLKSKTVSAESELLDFDTVKKLYIQEKIDQKVGTKSQENPDKSLGYQAKSQDNRNKSLDYLAKSQEKSGEYESQSQEKSIAIEKRSASNKSLRVKREEFDERVNPQNNSFDSNEGELVKFSNIKYINPSVLQMPAKKENDSSGSFEENSIESTPSSKNDYITIVYQTTSDEVRLDDYLDVEGNHPTPKGDSLRFLKDTEEAKTRKEGGEWIVTSSPEASSLTNMKTTAKSEPLRTPTNKFGNATGCTVYFTVPILSGLMTTSILLTILFFGIVMIMDLRTYDKFDDPQGPSLNVPSDE